MNWLKSINPIIILAVAMTLVGLTLFFTGGDDVFWAGFFSMILFYLGIFYLGQLAAKRKKEENVDDVLLAGRDIPLWIAVFTMSATWIGGGFINGSAEYTASWGLLWVQAPWGYALSLMVGGLFFAKRMRKFKFKTMLDPLEQRFGKRMTAVLFIPALMGELFWTGAILTALGTTFGTVLGIGFQTSIILSAFIAIAYTALGGLWSVALTDVLQLILLFGGLLLVVPVALNEVGGLDQVWLMYQEKKGALATLIPSREALGTSYWTWWDYALLLILGGIPWQVYFQRVLSAKSGKIAVRLSVLAGFICLLAAIPAVLIGMIADVYPWVENGLPVPAEAAATLPHVVRYLTNPWVATIGLGAIAAAVMSSADSSILSASSMATWNVYRPLVKPKITTTEMNKVLKNCIWIIGIAATLMALQIKSVYALWFLCSDFVYCLLFPQLVTALFDKKANVYGSIAGFVVAFILRFGGGDPTLGIPTILPYPLLEDGSVLIPFRTLAMVSGLLSIVIVSRLSQRSCPAKSLEVQE